jgi:hypothetical protein
VTEPREQWTQGSEEPPADVKVLRYEKSLPNPYLRRMDFDLGDDGVKGGWVVESSADPRTWSAGIARSWKRRAEHIYNYGPLTEVLPGSTPETWEPKPGDTVWTEFGEELAVVPIEPAQLRTDAFVLTKNRAGQKYMFAVSDLRRDPPFQWCQEAANTGSPESSDGGDVSSRVSSEELREQLTDLIDEAAHCDWFSPPNQVADALLDAGWRPPLPKMDVAMLVGVVGGLIDEFFGDDHAEASRAAAKAILERGFLDKTGAVGPPEPVASTLRRIIRDLEREAVQRDSRKRDLGGGFTEQSIDDVVGAEVLREYADRLRGHPVLTGEPGKDPLPACGCAPFDNCETCFSPERQRETEIRQLAYCETSVQASADPEDGEQCPEPREPGSVYCKRHTEVYGPDSVGSLGARPPSPLPDDETEDLRARLGALRATHRDALAEIDRLNTLLPDDETEWAARLSEKNALMVEAAQQLTTNADLMDRMKSIGDRVINAWESLDGESTATGVTTPLDQALGALRDLLRERPARAERGEQS